MEEQLLTRNQEQDIFYLAGSETQVLMCFIDNGDKYYAAPSHKGWLTKKQAQEWVKRRYGELIDPKPLNTLKPKRKTMLAAVTALSASIKELQIALKLQQEKLTKRGGSHGLKVIKNMQAAIEAEKERLELVKLLLKKAQSSTFRKTLL